MKYKLNNKGVILINALLSTLILILYYGVILLLQRNFCYLLIMDINCSEAVIIMREYNIHT